jgi:hypothetical protein
MRSEIIHKHPAMEFGHFENFSVPGRQEHEVYFRFRFSEYYTKMKMSACQLAIKRSWQATVISNGPNHMAAIVAV